jgi:Rrf2 family protein
MLKLSTKGRYGVRLMLDLAVNSGQGAVALNDVAKRQDSSVKYLEQLVILLKKSGLVRSVRGINGVYFIKSAVTDNIKEYSFGIRRFGLFSTVHR